MPLLRLDRLDRTIPTNIGAIENERGFRGDILWKLQEIGEKAKMRYYAKRMLSSFEKPNNRQRAISGVRFWRGEETKSGVSLRHLLTAESADPVTRCS